MFVSRSVSEPRNARRKSHISRLETHLKTARDRESKRVSHEVVVWERGEERRERGKGENDTRAEDWETDRAKRESATGSGTNSAAFLKHPLHRSLLLLYTRPPGVFTCSACARRKFPEHVCIYHIHSSEFAGNVSMVECQ